MNNHQLIGLFFNENLSKVLMKNTDNKTKTYAGISINANPKIPKNAFQEILSDVADIRNFQWIGTLTQPRKTVDDIEQEYFTGIINEQAVNEPFQFINSDKLRINTDTENAILLFFVQKAKAVMQPYKQEYNPKYTNELKKQLKKWFTPFDFLSQWFSENDILRAISEYYEITTMNDLENQNKLVTEEKTDNYAHIKYYQNQPKTYEYLREDYACLPQYDRYGRQYLESRWAKCMIFRTVHPIQNTLHGAVTLHLLYQKYPQLKPFQFSAHAIRDTEDYEIYPANNIYTPWDALMEKDIDRIIKRNQDYAKAYNHGIFRIKETEKRLASEETKNYFDIIRNL